MLLNVSQQNIHSPCHIFPLNKHTWSACWRTAWYRFRRQSYLHSQYCLRLFIPQKAAECAEGNDANGKLMGTLRVSLKYLLTPVQGEHPHGPSVTGTVLVEGPAGQISELYHWPAVTLLCQYLQYLRNFQPLWHFNMYLDDTYKLKFKTLQESELGSQHVIWSICKNTHTQKGFSTEIPWEHP